MEAGKGKTKGKGKSNKGKGDKGSSKGNVCNSCITTHGKNDTHKSRRVVLVFHISSMKISL